MITITNNLGIDMVIANWLASDSYSGYSQDNKTTSATTLLRSARQRVLGQLLRGKDFDTTTDIATMLNTSMGTAIHSGIQHSWEDSNLRTNALKSLGFSDKLISKIRVNPEIDNPDFINLYFEKRVSREIDGWTISGQFDLVFNGNLHDFKSTSTYTYINKTKEKDYIKQGSIYRWLNPELITGDFITIHYIFTNWNKNYALSDPKYPPHPFVSIDLPLMSLAETEQFIRSKIHENDRFIDDLDNLPLCDDKTLMIDNVWQYFASSTSTKASKNFDSEREAIAFQAQKGKGFVKKKPLEPKGCNYCNCKAICSQYKQYVATGLIKE